MYHQSENGVYLMSLIVDYIVAMTNLYGFVSKEKAIEIYNMQNDDKLDVSDLDHVLEHHTDDLVSRFAFPEGDYFIHETIYIFDEFGEQLARKQGKPYYIPPKKELLKYKDQYYFERSKEYRALRRYVARHFFKGQEYQAEMLCSDIHIECKSDFKLNDIFYHFERRDIVFDDEKQVGEVIDLVMDLSNNVRLWENNGFTPKELMNKMRKNNPNVVSEMNAERPMGAIKDVSTDRVDWKKIGRNDPCPCGSGKKYKRCCLK